MGNDLNIALLYILLDDLFGLDPIDWEERIIVKSLVTGAETTEPPSSLSSPPNSSLIVGNYYDLGYGHLNINLVSQRTLLDLDLDLDIDMTTLIDDIRKQQGHAPNLPPSYIATLCGVHFQAILFSHFDGPIYNTTVFAVRKTINGEALPVIKYSSSAVFVPGEGIGMFDNFWAGEEGKRPVTENVADEAEV